MKRKSVSRRQRAAGRITPAMIRAATSLHHAEERAKTKSLDQVPYGWTSPIFGEKDCSGGPANLHVGTYRPGISVELNFNSHFAEYLAARRLRQSFIFDGRAS